MIPEGELCKSNNVLLGIKYHQFWYLYFDTHFKYHRISPRSLKFGKRIIIIILFIQEKRLKTNREVMFYL